jgi:hypothetical protein
VATIRKTKSRDSQSVLAAARDLKQGEVLLPGDDAYVNARQIWNGAVEHRPALFALRKTVEEVQTGVRVARTHALPLSVRGGGKDLRLRCKSHPHCPSRAAILAIHCLDNRGATVSRAYSSSRRGIASSSRNQTKKSICELPTLSER